MSETDCALKEFGNCSYSETGCSDCKVKAKIRNALSAQPEPCEDAVSRKDVIDLYKRGAEIIAKAKGISVEDMPHNGLDALMNLPPVTPKLSNIDFLMPESELVFYDNDHGFCINTQDVLEHIMGYMQ